METRHVYLLVVFAEEALLLLWDLNKLLTLSIQLWRVARSCATNMIDANIAREQCNATKLDFTHSNPYKHADMPRYA